MTKRNKIDSIKAKEYKKWGLDQIQKNIDELMDEWKISLKIEPVRQATWDLSDSKLQQTLNLIPLDLSTINLKFRIYMVAQSSMTPNAPLLRTLSAF